MSLVATAVQPDGTPTGPLPEDTSAAIDVTEVLTQQLSAAKTGTKAPINTPVDATGQSVLPAADTRLKLQNPLSQYMCRHETSKSAGPFSARDAHPASCHIHAA